MLLEKAPWTSVNTGYRTAPGARDCPAIRLLPQLALSACPGPQCPLSADRVSMLLLHPRSFAFLQFTLMEASDKKFLFFLPLNLRVSLCVHHPLQLSSRNDGGSNSPIRPSFHMSVNLLLSFLSTLLPKVMLLSPESASSL